MTVSAQAARNESTAVAGATAFPYAFKIIAATDLLVQVNGITKVLNADYTVSGVGADGGGTVTFLVPMDGGELVLRKRNMAYARGNDYQTLGDLQASTLNSDLDSPVLMCQQLDDKFNDFGDAIADGVAGLYQNPGPGSVLRFANAKMAEWISPEDFGAVGDGIADDSVAFQAALDYIATRTAGRLLLVAPVYQLKNVTIGSNTTIFAPFGSTLRLPSTASIANDFLLSNTTTGTYTDSEIALVGVTFDGNNLGNEAAQTRFTPLVKLHRILGLRLINCRFTNTGYIGAAIGGSRRVQIQGCKFYGCGYGGAASPISNGGPALWCAVLTINNITGITKANPAVVTSNAHGFSNGDSVFISAVEGMLEVDGRWFTVAGATANTFQLSGVDSSAYGVYTTGGTVARDHPEDVRLVDCQFHDNEWCGAHVSARRALLSSCHFRNNRESHFYAPHTDGTVAEDYSITACVFDNVREDYISSNAMELQLIRATITGNSIYRCGQSGISLSSSRDVTVAGNTIGNTQIDGIGGAAINLVMDDRKGLTSNITISNNTIFDDQAVPTTQAAIIGFAGYVGASAASGIKINGNTFAGPFYSATLVTNGTFAVDANWTKGAGWAIAAGKATATASNAGLDQTEGLVAGKLYRLTYTVSGFAAGTVKPQFTGGTTVSGTARAANGTYTELIRASSGNNNLRFLATGATLSIDDVILQGVDAFADFNSALPESACFISGNTGWTGANRKWPRMQVGTFGSPGVAQDQVVSGIGFRPVRVELDFLVGGAGNYKHGWSTVESDGTAICYAEAVTAASCGASNRGNIAVSLVDVAIAETCRASFVSFDEDGFTLNYSVVTDTPTVRYTAYPD